MDRDISQMSDKLSWRHVGFVLAIASMQFLGVALQLNTSGIFYKSVAEELGVGLGAVSFYISMAYIVSIFLMPVGERLMNRFSIRLIYVVANLCLVAGFFINAAAHSVWMMYLAGALMAGCVTFNMYLMPVLVARWFKKSTGFVVGLCGSLTGLGSAIFNPVGATIIAEAGWRMGYVVFGLLILVIVVPLVLAFVRSNPEDVGVRAYGALSVAEDSGDGLVGRKVSGADFAAVMKSAAFPMLVIMALCGGSVAVMSQYMTSFALDVGYLAVVGATMTSAAMIGNMGSKILLGAVADRNISIAVIAAVVCPVIALGGLMAVGGSSAILIVAVAFFYGFVQPSNTVILPLVIQKLFGDKDYGRIWAMIAPFSCIACAAGATMWGWIYDGTGSFHIVFIIGIALLCIRLVSYFITKAAANKIPHTETVVEEKAAA